jgi:glucokinase
MFVSILGTAAGNMVLSYMATGGVYIGGGIPPRILSFLKNAQFMKAFRNKGRFSKLNANVPVHVILHQNAGLLGMASFGLKQVFETNG